MSMPCAYCLCLESRRVPFRWVELPLALCLVRPYRCAHCCRRFLAPAWRARQLPRVGRAGTRFSRSER
jgi:hypothetical protein